MENNAMVENSYALIAIDVDGTLLTSEKKILPETLLALKRVSDKGVQLSYATGRAFVEMAEFFELTPMIRYAILYSGAIIYDCAMKKNLFKMEIPASLFGDIIQVAEKYHVNKIRRSKNFMKPCLHLYMGKAWKMELDCLNSHFKTADYFCSFSDYHNKTINHIMERNNTTFELMVHPGHPRYEEENSVLRQSGGGTLKMMRL